jgi:hypothetical protein
MYLETLRLRMEPEKFGVLSEAGFDGTGFDVNEELFTDDVRRELATVLTMAATGRTDDLVEVVEGDPGMGCMVVTAEVADDPVKLAEVRAKLRRMVDEGELPK